MTELLLEGLRVDTPATHLAALGLLRALDRHGLPARMAWRGGCAALDSDFADAVAVAGWLAGTFAPVPIIAPWQTGGCYADAVKSPRSGQLPLEEAARRAEPGSRLAAYRRVFEVLDRDVLPQFGTRLDGKTPDKKHKRAIIRECRAWLPDEALPFVDLAAVLTEDDTEPNFGPALGGAGGMDGNQAIDTRYIRALIEIGVHEEREETREAAHDWALSLLTGRGKRLLPRLSDGLLDAGTTNELDGIPGKTTFANNPWQTVLALEGMLLLGGSVHTRESRGQAAFPWMVTTSARQDRDGAADLYLPEWQGWRDAGAVAELYARGRLRAGQRRAADVAAVTAAVRAVGPQLGVRRFQEFRLTKRRGGNPNLTAVGALVVPEQADDDLLLADLGPLLSLRRDDLGGSLRQLVRLAEQAVRAPGHDRFQALLAAARILRYAETRPSERRLPAVRLRRGWAGVLAGEASGIGRLALAIATGLRARRKAVESEAVAERADLVLASPRPLTLRVLDGPTRPSIATPSERGTGAGLLWRWVTQHEDWDEPLAALVALLRRSGLGAVRIREPDGLLATPGPWAVIAPLALAVQPLPEWEADPAEEVAVLARRASLQAAYAAAVRRLHRLGAGVEVVEPPPQLTVVPERLACALATPIDLAERRRLSRFLLTPTPEER
jgi:CRISPR-associated protein Csx17